MESKLQSVWHTKPESLDKKNNSATSKTSFESNKPAWENENADNNHVDNVYRRLGAYFKCIMMGAVPGMLIGCVILAVVVTFWITSPKQTSTEQFVTTSQSLATTASTTVATTAATTASTTAATTASTTVATTAATTAAPTAPTTAATSTTVSTISSSTSVTGSVCGVNMQWNSTGVTIAGVTGSNGNALNQLYSPIGISVFSNGSIVYIADTDNNRIVKWTIGASSGVLVSVSGGALSQPYGVYVDSNENVYVSDLRNSRIQFYPSGSTTGITISSGWVTALDKPSCIYVRNNTIYVCDKGLNVILRNGSTAAGTGSGAAGDIQISYGLTVDTNGTMYIANFQHNVIVKWLASTASSSAGTVIAGSSSGTLGSTSSLLSAPTSVAQDSQGNLYVVDQGNHRIQLFCQYPTASATAITIAGTGSPGATSTTLSSPTGIALDSSLNVYVTDTGNHRVQMFQRIS